jgi:hypothetical protein
VIDPLGAVITVAGMALAYLAGRRARKTPATQVKPICPCGHAIAYHENGTGPCRQLDSERIYTEPGMYHDEMLPCACQQYSGPELVSSMTLREISIRPTTGDG